MSDQYNYNQQADISGDIPGKNLSLEPEETLASILSDLAEVIRSVDSDAKDISRKIFGNKALAGPTANSAAIAKEPSIRDMASKIRTIARNTGRTLEHIRQNF